MNKLKLPFRWNLYVAICPIKELNNRVKKLGVTFNFNEKEKVAGMAEFIYKETPKSSFFIVWVNNDKPDYFYYLIHEIYHIVSLYCEHLEINDEEFRAYLFEDICKQLKLGGGSLNEIKNK